MGNPTIITDPADGFAVTALEVMNDLVVQLCPGCIPGVDVTMQYDTDTPGLVRFISELPNGTVQQTHGKAVAYEQPRISIAIRGNPQDYGTPKTEAVRLRYAILSQGEYTSKGLRIMGITPYGVIRPLGRDNQGREGIEIMFDVMTEPSYV
jgi:hypothetical protein